MSPNYQTSIEVNHQMNLYKHPSPESFENNIFKVLSSLKLASISPNSINAFSLILFLILLILELVLIKTLINLYEEPPII